MTVRLFDDVPQSTWVRPKGKNDCGRDPTAGPGTCWWWWEGCPNAEKKRCYHLWVRQQAKKAGADPSLDT